MMPDIDLWRRLGQLAYETYRQSRAERTFDGQPIPEWDEVGEGIQDGWMAAAMAVRRAAVE